MSLTKKVIKHVLKKVLKYKMETLYCFFRSFLQKIRCAFFFNANVKTKNIKVIIFFWF